MTNQEMFDLAVRGLAKQGWERSMARRPEDTGPMCVYQGDGGRRCAWGHVDPSLTTESGGVRTLKNNGLGVAATLSYDGVSFASELQNAHDDGTCPNGMIGLYIELCRYFGLVWPADVPQIVQSLEL